jgi:hypothetical protein
MCSAKEHKLAYTSPPLSHQTDVQPIVPLTPSHVPTVNSNTIVPSIHRWS